VVEHGAEAITFDFQVVAALEIHPEPLAKLGFSNLTS